MRVRFLVRVKNLGLGLGLGELERAAPTAADPKEKLALTSVRGCSGDGSEVGFGIDFGLRKRHNFEIERFQN